MTTRRRFFAPAGSFEAGSTTVNLPPEESRHLRDVLRLSPDARVFVFNGEGNEYECTVEEVRRDYVKLKIISEVSPASPEAPVKINLAVALLKGEKFELVVQKSTELGIFSITPVVTRFADIRIKDPRDVQQRLARWRRIALEAAKQCGRASVPSIAEPQDFFELLQTTPPGLMFSERSGVSFAEATASFAGAESLCALVGSEGGWADEEIEKAHSTGWKIVTLAGRTLRAETAAIAVAVLLQHLFGDLK